MTYPRDFSQDELQDMIARERIFAKRPIKPWPYKPQKETKPVVFRISA